jgi:hypothetical protein
MIIKPKKDSTLKSMFEAQIKQALELRGGNINSTKSLIDESNTYSFRVTKREIKRIADENGIKTLKRGGNV